MAVSTESVWAVARVSEGRVVELAHTTVYSDLAKARAMANLMNQGRHAPLVFRPVRLAAVEDYG